MIWWILLYITGYVLSYIYLKKGITKTFNNWTVGDRSMALILSIFSWVTIFATFISNNLQDLNFNKPAKW